MHLCNRKSARTKTIFVVHLISHKQQFTQQDKVVFKVASLLQRCLNLPSLPQGDKAMEQCIHRIISGFR